MDYQWGVSRRSLNENIVEELNITYKITGLYSQSESEQNILLNLVRDGYAIVNPQITNFNETELYPPRFSFPVMS